MRKKKKGKCLDGKNSDFKSVLWPEDFSKKVNLTRKIAKIQMLNDLTIKEN